MSNTDSRWFIYIYISSRVSWKKDTPEPRIESENRATFAKSSLLARKASHREIKYDTDPDETRIHNEYDETGARGACNFSLIIALLLDKRSNSELPIGWFLWIKFSLIIKNYCKTKEDFFSTRFSLFYQNTKSVADIIGLFCIM